MQLTFRNYDFSDPASGRYLADTAGLLSPPVLRGENFSTMLRAGRIHVSKLFEQRRFNVKVALVASTPAGVDEALDALKKALTPRVRDTLTWLRNDGVQVSAHAEINSVQAKRRTPLVIDVVVDITMADPYWYSAMTLYEVEIDTLPASITIVNDGNDISDNAVIRIKNQAGPLTIANAATGESLTVATAVGDGETLTIDCGAWTADLDGENRVGAIEFSGQSFFPLAPGENIITITSVNPTGVTAVVEFDVQSAFL